MDSMIVKILQSRKKSVAKLTAEVAELEAKRANATPSVAAVLQSVINVQRQRLARLTAEVTALETEAGPVKDERQAEIPAVTPPGRIPPRR